MLDEHKKAESWKKDSFLYGKIGEMVGLGDIGDDGEDMMDLPVDEGNNGATMPERFEEAKQKGWIKVVERSGEIDGQAVEEDADMDERPAEVKKGGRK